jgi:hypothetical protein
VARARAGGRVTILLLVREVLKIKEGDYVGISMSQVINYEGASVEVTGCFPQSLSYLQAISCFMERPEIRFGSWFRWVERNSIKDSDRCGVYMLSKFRVASRGSADPLSKNVIYFGETCNQSLRVRWRQFDDSAFQKKRGHSGGKNYRERYGDEGADLYVAAMPVKLEDEILRSQFIRFAERKLILDYVLKWKRLPECNLK